MRDPRINEILYEMAMIYAYEGVDSTEEDMDRAKAKEIELIGEIAKIDPDMGLRLSRNGRSYQN